MKVTKRDLLTPANAITLIGLVLTSLGSLRLNTWSGFILVFIGKFLDIFDGLVARRTRTSEFGGFLDATTDKITTLIVILSAYHFRLAPSGILLFIFLQHLIVGVLAVIAATRHQNLEVTLLGKHNMFLHMSTIFVFIWSTLVQGLFSDLLWLTAVILGVVSIVHGLLTLKSYIGQFRGLKRT